MSEICETPEIEVTEAIFIELDYAESYLTQGDTLTGPPTVVSSDPLIASVDMISDTLTTVIYRVTGISNGRVEIKCTIGTQLGANSVDKQEVYVKL